MDEFLVGSYRREFPLILESGEDQGRKNLKGSSRRAV